MSNLGYIYRNEIHFQWAFYWKRYWNVSFRWRKFNLLVVVFSWRRLVTFHILLISLSFLWKLSTRILRNLILGSFKGWAASEWEIHEKLRVQSKNKDRPGKLHVRETQHEAIHVEKRRSLKKGKHGEQKESLIARGCEEERGDVEG